MNIKVNKYNKQRNRWCIDKIIREVKKVETIVLYKMK